MEKQVEKPMFRLGLDALKVRSENDRTYLADAFFPDVKTASYHKDKIYLGTIYGEDDYVFEKNELKKFSVDAKSSDITLFIGLRGSGKTFSMRSDCSRSWRSGYACIVLDIKGEWRSNNEPASPEVLKLARLGENEKPEVIPTTMCIPLFLKKTYNGKPPEGDIFFQFSLSDTTEDDLLYVLKPANDNYKTAISLAHRRIKTGKIKTLEELRAFLLEQVNPQTARSVNLAIDSLISDGVFGDDAPLDIKYILETSVLALNINNYKEYDTEGGFVHLYVKMLLNKVIDLRDEKARNRLKKMVKLYIDEFHFFCPRDKYTYSKKAIIDIVNIYRIRGFSGTFCTQEIAQIPEKEILDSVRHVYIPQSIKSGRDSSFEVILKKFNAWRYAYDERKKWAEIKSHMKPHTWMYIDAEHLEKPIRLVRFYAPLCNHLMESRN